MRAVDLIRRKRDGGTMGTDEIDFLVRGAVSGDIPPYQVSAWLMAVFFRGMNAEETAALTRAMLESGIRMDLSGIAGPFVDKHSTGGVGDKTSLALAPAAAAMGLRVPMMSGRSLGHTGGTLDKLDSIPGYRSRLGQAEFRRVLEDVGYAMTGQTDEVVPADKLLYSLRDVTATVESIPLITASILSKKAAEGAQSLVLDVKAGSGAFMKDRASAEALAASLCSTWKAMGLRMAALVTDMETPLGRKVGNFLEVEEIIDCLEGHWLPDLLALTRRLGAWMAVLGGVAEDPGAGEAAFESAISSGKALDRFMRNVEAQGGDPDRLMALRGKLRAPLSAALASPFSGSVGRLDAFKTGLASTALGAGRSRAEDSVFPDVGIILEKKPGEEVRAGECLCVIYARGQEALDEAMALMGSAYAPAEAGAGSAFAQASDIVMKEILAL
jgi:pyrimidine-nucleoside phosphorylase